MTLEKRVEHIITSTHSFCDDAIGLIGIPTKDRHESLARILASIDPAWIRNFSGTIVIIDGSTRPEESSKAIVRAAEKRLGCRVHHRTKRETLHLARVLAKRVDVDETTLTIGLLGFPEMFSAGAARNELLLLQHGKTGAYFDDDIMLTYRALREHHHDLVVSGEMPLHIHLYERKEDIQHRLVSLNTSPLVVYDSWYRAWSSSGKIITTKRIDNPLRDRILHPDAYILTIQGGLYGDTCVQRFFELHHTVASRRALFSASEDTYRRLVHTSHVIQSAHAPTLTDQPLCIAAHIMIAGERIVPPFPPVGRAEDFAAGVIAHLCCVGSLSLHLPVLVDHDRDDTPPMCPLSNIALPPSNRILAGIIGQHTYQGTTEENLAKAGKVLLSLSDGVCADFQARILEHVRYAWHASIESLSSMVAQTSNAPPHWKRHLEEHIDALLHSCNTPTERIAKQVGSEQFWNQLHNAYRAYGTILTLWPALWRISREENLLTHTLDSLI